MPASEETEAPDEETELEENVGARLRRAREAQEVSLDVISAELRISARSLSALEECRFEELGPPVFAKGYLKQYGARLGLDVAELVAAYERAAGAGAGAGSYEIAPSRSIRLRDERQVTIWVIASIVLLLIAGILAFWWWLGRDAATPAAELAGQPFPGGVTGTGIERRPVPPASRGPSSTRPAPIPAPSERAPVAGQTRSGRPDSEAAGSVAAATGPELEILFVADSWAEITDDAGERLYYGLGRAGTRATIPADRKLNLFFGYADGVSLSIDGEPLAVPASARRRDNLAQFEIEARVSRDP